MRNWGSCIYRIGASAIHYLTTQWGLSKTVNCFSLGLCSVVCLDYHLVFQPRNIYKLWITFSFGSPVWVSLILQFQLVIFAGNATPFFAVFSFILPPLEISNYNCVDMGKSRTLSLIQSRRQTSFRHQTDAYTLESFSSVSAVSHPGVYITN